MLINPSFYRRLLVLIILVVSAATQCALAERMTGRVVGVTDGDTIKLLLPGNYQEKVRLYGIDCPEKKQPFGTKQSSLPVTWCLVKLSKLIESIKIDMVVQSVGLQ